MKLDNAELTYEEHQRAKAVDNLRDKALKNFKRFLNGEVLIYKGDKYIIEENLDAWANADFEPKEKHAKIKAEYAAAKEAEKNGGDIVKRFWRRNNKEWKEVPSRDSSRWFDGNEYKLRYYRINWSKVLAWSYANGVFVECEFSDDKNFNHDYTIKSPLYGYIDPWPCFIPEDPQYVRGEDKERFRYCRPAPGVEIRDEWLEEVTDDSSTL